MSTLVLVPGNILSLWCIGCLTQQVETAGQGFIIGGTQTLCDLVINEASRIRPEVATSLNGLSGRRAAVPFINQVLLRTIPENGESVSFNILYSRQNSLLCV